MNHRLLAVLMFTVASVATPSFAPAQEGLSEQWIEQFDWRCIGPANMGGRIIDIEVYEADPCIWYAATASGGLLKTVNDGTTFEHLFDSEDTVSIGDLCISQSDPNLLWVGTGEDNPRNSVSYGDGVYKSEDGGRTWKHMGLSETFQIGRIQLHPTDADTVYVGALGRLYGPNEERGLFKTTDGGETWKKVLYVDEHTGVIDVVMSPADPDTLIVATYERARDGFDGNDPAKKNGPGSGLYRTTDGGESFTEVTEGLPTVNKGRIGLDVYRKDPNVVYAVIETELTSQAGENAGDPGMSCEDAETGARVTGVTEDGAAAAAGIGVGDVVLSVDGVVVLSATAMNAQIRRKEKGEALALKIARNREAIDVELTLAAPPEPEEDARPARGFGGRSPFSSGLGGQRENLQDQQGKQGVDHGGVFRSADGGVSWTRINSLNPRPMYYSQIRVDPADENHQFVLGTSLYRTQDGGATYTADGAGRGVHVDHHAMWIDPDDGRHVILGNDGGLYVTRDRSRNWDHLNFMALGQFYHVEVGPRRNYMVYGGLQDNGSWGVSHRSRSNSGPINEDWLSVGGGDGFVVRVDREDPDTIYTESQGGAMGRRNLLTGERASIRPQAPEGERYRFNWKTPFILSHHNSRIFYCAGNHVFRSLNRGDDLERISPDITLDEQGSGSALAESPFDAKVLYVGTTCGALWMTRNGGHDWLDLLGTASADIAVTSITEAAGEATAVEGDPGTGGNGHAQEEDDPISGVWNAKTQGTDRRGSGEFSFTLELLPNGRVTGTLSMRRRETPLQGRFETQGGGLRCTATSERGESVLEAVLEEGVLTGKLSMGGGAFEMEFSATRQEGGESSGGEVLAGGDGQPLRELIPGPMWVTSLEASRHEAGRVYLALDGHRSDRDDPYVFVSEDHGQTWTSLCANLPRGSSRCLREDLVNPDVLYLGTEFAAWVSVDRGASWTKLNGDTLPTVAVHEIAQHAGSGEIVAGTHGRSLWIADVTALRQMTSEVLAARAHLFEPNDVVLWSAAPRRGSSSLSTFVGRNPSNSAQLFYSLRGAVRNVSLEIHDAQGEVVRELEAEASEGLHRVDWDLQLAPDPNAPQGNRRFRGGRGFGRGRTAPAGAYTAVLEVDGEVMRKSFELSRDPEFPDFRYLAVERELEEKAEADGGDR